VGEDTPQADLGRLCCDAISGTLQGLAYSREGVDCRPRGGGGRTRHNHGHIRRIQNCWGFVVPRHEHHDDPPIADRHANRLVDLHIRGRDLDDIVDHQTLDVDDHCGIGGPQRQSDHDGDNPTQRFVYDDDHDDFAGAEQLLQGDS
jgi:hypothetical protein